MEAFTYKGISDGKYVTGDIEALNLDEASHLLKKEKNNHYKYSKETKKKLVKRRSQVALHCLVEAKK